MKVKGEGVEMKGKREKIWRRYYGLKVVLAICKRICDNIWALGEGKVKREIGVCAVVRW